MKQHTSQKTFFCDQCDSAFYEKREFTTEDICRALKELIPLAQLENNQTLKLQNWAVSGRIRSASSKDIYIT